MTPPNVVLMMMDDLAFGDLACHGNPYVQTPVLDGLYAESVRFTRYVSGPMCTPARASLMTGATTCARAPSTRSAAGR